MEEIDERKSVSGPWRNTLSNGTSRKHGTPMASQLQTALAREGQRRGGLIAGRELKRLRLIRDSRVDSRAAQYYNSKKLRARINFTFADMESGSWKSEDASNWLIDSSNFREDYFQISTCRSSVERSSCMNDFIVFRSSKWPQQSTGNGLTKKRGVTMRSTRGTPAEDVDAFEIDTARSALPDGS